MEDPGSDAYSGVDNLSRLPDDILSRILSLLCTEDAVCTSVLSTRWSFSGKDSWSRLFSNCPILEDFVYCMTRGGDCPLHVSSPTLKRLTIMREYGFFDVLVDAPSLFYLIFYIGEVESLKFVNTESLVIANIDISGPEGEVLCSNSVASELMRGISNIQLLRMCAYTVNALSVYRIPVPMFHNLIHLTIYDCYLGLLALPYLLEKCESLETLVLEDRCNWCSDAWNRVEESRISCLASVVKTIKVGKFTGKESQIEMVKYFLKVARVLECMEIHLDSECENPSEIANELQMLPKNSEAFMDVIF